MKILTTFNGWMNDFLLLVPTPREPNQLNYCRYISGKGTFLLLSGPEIGRRPNWNTFHQQPRSKKSIQPKICLSPIVLPFVLILQLRSEVCKIRIETSEMFKHFDVRSAGSDSFDLIVQGSSWFTFNFSFVQTYGPRLNHAYLRALTHARHL